MSVVLVAGGAGTLGREVVRLLAGRADRVRVLSRRAAPETVPPRVDWARGDVVTGEGLDDAFAGVGTVVHAATTQPGAGRGGRGGGRRDAGSADVDGTERLLDAAARAGIFHFLYVSIVGMEGVPIGYYRAKLAAEAMVAEGTVPWSILRITQFHPLIDTFMTMLGGGRRPFVLPAGLRFQPIDPADAGRAVVAAVDGGAAGRLPDVGGPEVRESHDLARSWLAARDRQRRVWPLPLPGRIGRNLRAGALTCPDRRVGVVTWEQWLVSRSGRAPTGG